MKKTIALILVAAIALSTSAIALAGTGTATTTCPCGSWALYQRTETESSHYAVANPMHGDHRDTTYIYRQWFYWRCMEGCRIVFRTRISDYQNRVCPK